ncbi:MAG: glycine--tRNA ligase subunit beta [Proteobacteria bacterium]|nr:glycine--tRNA ligase subunit beta [Pseudomonadota bacterium]
MAELLLELLSEEIPARMQARAAEDLKRLVCQGLKDAGLEFDRAEAFATPRRLALVVDGLPKKQPDQKIERKGPRVGAPKAALEGFLRSLGKTLDDLDSLEKRDSGKDEVYFAVEYRKGRQTGDVLPPIIVHAINNLKWPKSMRWAETIFTWVRPLHGILAVFDGKPLQQNYGLGIRSASRMDAEIDQSRFIDFTNKTVGHRFLSPEQFEVKDFADYKAKLKKAKVILDPAERRQVIEREARSQKTSFGRSSLRLPSSGDPLGYQVRNCVSVGSQRKIAVVTDKRSGPSASPTGNGGPRYTRLLNPGRIS